MTTSGIDRYRAQIKATLYPRGDNMFEAFRETIEGTIANRIETQKGGEEILKLLYKMAAKCIYDFDVKTQRDIGGLVWANNSCFADVVLQTLFYKPILYIYTNILYKRVSPPTKLAGTNPECKITVLKLQQYLRETKELLQGANLFIKTCVDILKVLAYCKGFKLGILHNTQDVYSWLLDIFDAEKTLKKTLLPPSIYSFFEHPMHSITSSPETKEPFPLFNIIAIANDIDKQSFEWPRDFLIISEQSIRSDDEMPDYNIVPLESFNGMDLIAIVVFIGGHDGGHYVNFIKWPAHLSKEKGKTWHFYDALDRTETKRSLNRTLQPYSFENLYPPTDFSSKKNYITEFGTLNKINLYKQAVVWIYAK